MSSKSNDQGRAYEYACVYSLRDEIGNVRNVEVVEGSSLLAAKEAWDRIDPIVQGILKISAKTAAKTILELEPLLVEDDDKVLLQIQKDSEGEIGDVRDIVITRKTINWEIGLSIKHNHFAVKHSRLGKNLDFGKRWFGIPCSDEYWSEIKPIFDFLQNEKDNDKYWRELDHKEEKVYIPLLKAFINELNKCSVSNKSMPAKMVEYLLGEYDFYKIISIDNKKTTQVQTFNLRGTLNKSGKNNKSQYIIPMASLPTRIVSLDFKPNSNNTVELYMDEGWQFSFRIHNASSKVETSLKFDIQIIGIPATILTINSIWQ